MPELPGRCSLVAVSTKELIHVDIEVERAAKLTRHVAVGRTIDKVETLEDTIVYTGGITHDEFVGLVHHFKTARKSKLIFGVVALGKRSHREKGLGCGPVWQGVLYHVGWGGEDACVASWHDRDGTGVQEFTLICCGLSNDVVQVKGEEPTWYRRRNKDLSADVWPPPRFLKVRWLFNWTKVVV
jgi:formamidopyrimidine-DNA glycosylase